MADVEAERKENAVDLLFVFLVSVDPVKSP